MKKISLIITQILLFGGIFSLVGCGAPTPIESTETLPQTELTEETQTTEHAAESTLPSTFEEAKALISNPFAPFLKVVSTTGSSQSAIETNILYKSDNGKISIANTIATQQDITEKKFWANISVDFSLAHTLSEKVMSLSTKANLLLTEKTLFAKLRKFEITGLEEIVGAETNETITDLIDQWIKLPLDEITSGAQEEIHKNFSLDTQQGSSIKEEMQKRFDKTKEILQEYPNLFIISELTPYNGTFEQFKGKSAFQINIDKEVLKQLLEDLDKQKTELTESFLPTQEQNFPEDTNLTPYEIPENKFDLPPFLAHIVIIDHKNVAITFEAESTNDYSETTTRISGRYGADGLFFQVNNSESTGHLINLQIIKDKAETSKERFTISLAVQGLGNFAGNSAITSSENWSALSYELTFTPSEDSILMLFLSSEKNLSLTFKGEISHKQIGSINLTEPTDYKDFNKVIEKFEQSAKSNPTQGRARDIARQNHITQLLSAIVAYQSMNGKRPGLDTKRPQSTSVLNEYLIDQGILSKLPTDPDKNSIVFWLGLGGQNEKSLPGEFLYAIMDKNSIQKIGVILMAKTETPEYSNRVIGDENGAGRISPLQDLQEIKLCTTIELTNSRSNDGLGNCTYSDPEQLRYIYIY